MILQDSKGERRKHTPGLSGGKEIKTKNQIIISIVMNYRRHLKTTEDISSEFYKHYWKKESCH